MRSTFLWRRAFLSSKSLTSFKTDSRRVTSAWATRIFSSISLIRDRSTHHWTRITRSPIARAPKRRRTLSLPAAPRAATPFFFLEGFASERRLILIIAPPALVAQLPDGQPHADGEGRGGLREPLRIDVALARRNRAERVQHLDGHAELLLQDLVELRDP